MEGLISLQTCSQRIMQPHQTELTIYEYITTIKECLKGNVKIKLNQMENTIYMYDNKRMPPL